MYLTKKQIAMADQYIEFNVGDDPNNPIYYRTLPVYEKLVEILNTTYLAITHLQGLPTNQHRKDSSTLNSVDVLGYMVNILVKDHEKLNRKA
jgi:hypothetical protein